MTLLDTMTACFRSFAVDALRCRWRTAMVASGLAFASLALCTPCYSEESSAVEVESEDSILSDEQAAIADACAFAERSVVQVETFGGRELVEDSAVAAGPSSGTVIDAEGWIVTSLFQFRNEPASITVLLQDGTRRAAKLVARDYAREFALLKIDSQGLLAPPVLAPPDERLIGQWTIALGKTFDLKSASRSVGILSATDRIFGRAIQTDCKISPHNYGGPLIDIQGRVMGILAPIDPGIATEGEVQQWYDSGIGFAIPIEEVIKRFADMKKGRDVYPGKAGIRPKINNDFYGPVVLAGVSPGSPASKAGLLVGDRLISIEGKPIFWPNHIRHALGNSDAESSVKIEYERTIDGSATRRSADCKLVRELPIYSMPFVGVLLDHQYRGKGVRVLRVLPDGPADKAGILRGEIITQFDGQPIEDLASFRRTLAFKDYREPMMLTVMRDATEVQEPGERIVKIQAEVAPSVADFLKVAAKLEEASEAKIEAKIEGEGSNEDASSKVKAVDKQLVAPNDDAKAIEDQVAATNPDGASAAIETGIVPIVLADVKNQAFAYVPPEYDGSNTYGLVLVLAEPGQVDRKKWVDPWEQFCRDHRYILAVIGSSSPEAWTREELEVCKRTLQEVKSRYRIEEARTVIGGIGGGSLHAISLGFEMRANIGAIWASLSTIPGRGRIPQAEPLESPYILLQAKEDGLKKLVEVMRKSGYLVSESKKNYEAENLTNVTALKEAQALCQLLEWM